MTSWLFPLREIRLGIVGGRRRFRLHAACLLRATRSINCVVVIVLARMASYIKLVTSSPMVVSHMASMFPVVYPPIETFGR